MDESAIKGLELNDCDADIPKSSSIVRIVVEGYDTFLAAYDVNLGLREHFASCGEVIHVHFPGYDASRTPVLSRFALVYIRGEGAIEKALKLSGSDMGGRKVIAKAYPLQAKQLDPEFASILAASRDQDNRQQRTMGVTGFDTTLPRDVVASTLRKHFSKCGTVQPVRVFHDHDLRKTLLRSKALITVDGEDTLEKVLLQLGGCDVDGFKNIQVSLVSGPPKRERERHGYNPKYYMMKRLKEFGVECSKKNKTSV
uniref:Nucleolin 1 n=1 Tax=Noccaea caerulescens TaxID=107243 RepID=A0A1J3JT93_NOCCA